jgi:hypothetical protein
MAEFQIGWTVRSPDRGVGTIVAVLARGVEIRWERACLDDPWAADLQTDLARVRTWRAGWESRPRQRFAVVEIAGGGYGVEDSSLVTGGTLPGVLTLERALTETRWRNAREELG